MGGKGLGALVVAVLLTGCGRIGYDGRVPADVAGEYTVTVTNRANDCAWDDWTTDEMFDDIAVTVVQNGAFASAEVTGFVGAYLDIGLGSNRFSGEVDGAEIHLILHGDTLHDQGTCTYTLDSTLDGRVEGDWLAGEIRYLPVSPSGATGCLSDCANTQDFYGTRPSR